VITAEAKESALAKLVTSTDFGALADAGLIIEAVPEREELKRDIYKSLLPVIGPDTILASNTSSISITRLAAMTDRPAKFIGMHFFNPVPMMKLVEIIRGIATDDATYDTIFAIAEKLGKTVASAEDAPGFIVNRILCPMINEAVFALHEGVGTVTSIDAGMKLGANHPMGPLELADFVGLDTLLSVMRVLQAGIGDDKYRPCPLLVKYVEAGWLGRKSGRGFYDYSVTPPKPTK
jgi:3-hydroxybutyryl-CoA dehydrogenase